MEVQRIWKIDGKRPLQPGPIADTATEAAWPMDWYGKVNSVTCPRGRRYGEAHFLVSTETLDAIKAAVTLDITCEHENGTTTWPGYYLIRTEAVSQDPDSPAHWITLADRRWILERSAANVRYNLRKSDTEWVVSSTDGGTPYTWQEILDDLWALLPAAAGTAPTLPITPGSTPENFVFDGAKTWRAINQVLTACGCGAVLNPLTGTFSYVELKAEQAGLSALKTANRNRLLWDFAPEELPSANYPEKVAVTFHYIPGTDDTDAPFPILPETEEATLGQGGAAGTKYPIVDTMFAYDDNSAARTARAAEIKDALIGLFRPSAAPWGSVFSGVVEFPLGSELTEVTWSSDGHRGMQTIAKYSGFKIDWPKLILSDAPPPGVIIEYVINSLSTKVSGPYTGLVAASATIKGCICGQGATLIDGDDVEIIDHSGCIFDEEDMTDYTGWAASNMEYKSLAAGAPTGELSPCHYAAINRCCAPNSGTYA